MSAITFPGRVGLQQRIVPAYRATFMDALAQACQGGVSVFAGEPLPVEGIGPLGELKVAHLVQSENRYFLDPSSLLFLCWQGGFLSWLGEWQPDVLIVEANPRYINTRLAIGWMHRRGRKVVGWGLGAPPIDGPLARLRRWERMSLLNSLDAIIAYSQQGAEQYRSLGFPAERVYIASNAVSTAPAVPPPERPAGFDKKAVALFVGRLQARKRADLLLRACAALPQTLQPRLVIVGDGPVRQQLESLARQIYPQAEFVGARHGTEVEPFFREADLFVLPGTGGLAIQQAMAYALPVIVAKGDGTQDDLVGSQNGWQVPPDDLNALAGALIQAISNPLQLRRMGMESYRIIKEEINVECMVQVFVEAMNDLNIGEKAGER